MPRPPAPAPATEALPGTVYSPVTSGVDTVGGTVCPLNVGDTWRAPLTGARVETLRQADHPDLHRYTDPRGTASLRAALSDKLRQRNGIEAAPEAVIVTAGATTGLAAAVAAVASPGEEVLILAPFWPLIRGAVQSYRARPVEVPFYDRVDSAESAVEAVKERITSRSVALYVSTPSNPTGRVLPGDWLAALAELARRENLWLISDEVYEDYVYAGEHVSLAPMAPERTITAFSFSKAYGMAGNRVGYLAGTPELVDLAGRVSTHTAYSAPTAGQLAAEYVLEHGAGWVSDAREAYREVAVSAASQLGIEPPAGSTFLFLDVSSRLDERGIDGFLADCHADGVALSPGRSCGGDYATWVRLCYTAAPPAEVLDAIARVARRLA